MSLRLELVVVPVSNVEQVNAFYAEQLGFRVDHDTVISSEERLVQPTPGGLPACVPRTDREPP